MRFIAIPILILLVMTQTFSNWFVVMAFNLNRDYIAKNLCENRYRPQMHCNGNCVLMKKMKEKEKSEQDQPVSRAEIGTIVLSSRTSFVNSIPPVPVLTISSTTDTRSDKPIDRAGTIFQPPRA